MPGSGEPARQPGPGPAPGWPDNVGILAMDIYFPHQFVDQVSTSQSCVAQMVETVAWWEKVNR